MTNETDWICLIWLGLKRHDDMINVGKDREGKFWLMSGGRTEGKKLAISEEVFNELCCSDVAVEDL